MLVKISTNKTVSEAVAALQSAVQANHFGVMQVHNLKETMEKMGVKFAPECLIFEVHQPQQAMKVLDLAVASRAVELLECVPVRPSCAGHHAVFPCCAPRPAMVWPSASQHPQRVQERSERPCAV